MSSERIGFIMFLLSASFLWRRSSAFSTLPPSLRPPGGTILRPSLRTHATTEYTIEEHGVDPDVLENTTRKHWDTLQRYLSEKPIALHTREAFTLLQQQLKNNDRPVILDR